MGITVTGGITFGTGLAVTEPPAAPVASYYLAVGQGDSSLISAYPWSSSSGFGTKFTSPTSAPGADRSTAVSFSPQGDAIALSFNAAPTISAYQWSSSGFGTKFANPAPAASASDGGIAFSPSGNVIAIGGYSSPNLSAYQWSGSGFGTRFADPAGYLGWVRGVAFAPAGNAVAAALNSYPNIAVYAWSASGFGTKFSDPATLPPSEGYKVTFSPSSDAIAVAGPDGGGVQGLSVYPWSGSGFGTKFTVPGTVLLGETTYGTAFSPSGDAIAAAYSGGLSVWQWSGSGFGTKFAGPETALADQTDVKFSPLGDAIATVGVNPTLSAYPWSGSGFGTRFANPASIPPFSYTLNFGTIQ
jgi:hypothetical protein